MSEIVSGERFASALQSGIHRVIAEQNHLNRINVFPVADGDTGTNLSLSLSAALLTLADATGQRLDALLQRVADSLLDGARGNSGAIMAQFFQGMSDAAEGQETFTADSFATAVTLGSEYAHDAIAEPREGTILSVIAAFARSARKLAGRDSSGSVAELIDHSLAVASDALKKTQQQLDVLRKAGVVDAGAKGFVLLMDGINRFLSHGEETTRPQLADKMSEALAGETAGEDMDLQYRFCTECMITGDDIDRRKLRESLSQLGNSMVVAGTKRKAKIHIHVNEPSAVFDLARRFGAVSGEKADDMRQQQHTSHSAGAKFAVITDSAADIPDDDLERLDIHIVPVRVQFGERGYMDKVSITPQEFFDEVRRNPIAPTTSQPAPGDFRRQYQFLATHFADVLSLSLTGTVSGTLQSAQTAAERIDAAGTVHVFDTLNASSGQGLLAVFAAECAAAGMSLDETMRELDKRRSLTRTFALIDDIRYAVRGGRVPAWVKTLTRVFRVTPVLATKPDGNIVPAGVIPGRRDPLPGFARLIARRVAETRPLRIIIGHAVCFEAAERLQQLLQESLHHVAKCSICELGTAIGVHGGPGTLVVGLQPESSS